MLARIFGFGEQPVPGSSYWTSRTDESVDLAAVLVTAATAQVQRSGKRRQHLASGDDMGRLANRLTDWWRRRQLSAPRIDSVMCFEMQHEAPTSIPRHTLILIGTEQHPKWAVFECPCGTGHKIHGESSPDPSTPLASRAGQ